VGFDPSEGRFRSWFFDSRGGFGGGPWSRVDDQYQISNLAVLPDGRLGSSVMKWRQADPDTVTFQATERVVGGQALPDSEQIYKRVK
jgi:hypothetical protein